MVSLGTKLPLIAALMTGCSPGVVQMPVQVDPRDAVIFVNGVEVASPGDGHLLLDFRVYDHVYVQAASPTRAPVTMCFTAQQAEVMIRQQGGLHIRLPER